MKREYTRPGLSSYFLKELLCKREILINPDWKEIESSLERVQRACRKNRLKPDDVKKTWKQFRRGGARSPSIGAIKCPNSYGYEMETTLFQVVEIAPDLTGVIIGREPTYPGTSTVIPISSGSNAPGKWQQQVVTAFWTHLNDQDIEEIHQKALVWLMTSTENALNELGSTNPRRARRRELQLQRLFRGVKPEFVSEFSNELRNTVALLNRDNLERISWKEFQIARPSLSKRYQKDLLGFIRNGYISTEELQSYVDDHQRYGLSLDSWCGPQKTFRNSQIVFRITASRLYEAIGRKGTSYMKLISTIKSDSESSYHPTTTNTVGWIRVHVDDENKISFIDEVQSDVMEYLYEIVQSKDSNADIASEILKEIKDWHLHAFATVQHWSRSIGYTTAIHSKQSAFSGSRNMTPSDRKWQTYYQSLIKGKQLVETAVHGYPGPIFLDTNVV